MVYSTDMEHTTRAVRRKAADRVKRRVASGASITDVAYLLGVPVSTAWRWVRGERLPNAASTRKILGGKQ